MNRLRTCLVACIVAIGCKTVEITPRPTIDVPPGLTTNDIEVAIIYDLANQPLPEEMTTGERIADNAMKALFLFAYKRVTPSQGSWYPESADEGVIYAGFEKGRSYLRVAIDYNDTIVQTRIVESRNLSQSDDRIHKAAIPWIEQLDSKIRRALGHLAMVRRLGDRKPEQGYDGR